MLAVACENFRDVGMSLELVTGTSIFPTGRLLRGGRIDDITDLTEIGGAATIINLRHHPDAETLGSVHLQFPAPNNQENYETAAGVTAKWLVEVMQTFADTSTELPVLVHCRSGKDRTGIVVAAVLAICGIDRRAIIDEYLLSDGEVRIEWIEAALDGFADLEHYFRRVDLEAVRRRFS